MSFSLLLPSLLLKPPNLTLTISFDILNFRICVKLCFVADYWFTWLFLVHSADIVLSRIIHFHYTMLNFYKNYVLPQRQIGTSKKPMNNLFWFVFVWWPMYYVGLKAALQLFRISWQISNLPPLLFAFCSSKHLCLYYQHYWEKQRTP